MQSVTGGGFKSCNKMLLTAVKEGTKGLKMNLIKTELVMQAVKTAFKSAYKTARHKKTCFRSRCKMVKC